MGQIVPTLMSLLIGACGGAIFAFLHAPLPWTLGSITASALAAILSNRWPMPAVMRMVARPVVGVLAGSAFTPEVFGAIGGWWKALIVLAIYSLITSVAGYFIFRRYVRLDPVTSYFAATPGGLGEFTLLGGSLGGRMPTIVLIHATRIVTIIFSIPIILQIMLGRQPGGFLPPSSSHSHELLDWLLLIGAGLVGLLFGRFKWFPGGPMIAAMYCSAVIHALGLTDASPPGVIVAFVQVLIGCVAGARFAGITWQEARQNAAWAMAWSLVLLASAFALAAATANMLDVPFESLLLAIAPGGGNEMIIVAYALQGDVAFVAFCQVARVFLVLSLAPVFFKYVERRTARKMQGKEP